MLYMMEKLKKLTTIRVLLHKSFYEFRPKYFAIFMHVIFRFASTSSIICGLELESCCRSVPMLETLYNTTHQQMQ
jgi:hypothetical protein